MSRLAKSSPAAKTRPGGDQDEICPVCKSSRYLNKSMRFLVNPECYHKMCESCVDRIFSHGPAQCPIPGCRKTLRKHRFREQTFEDIKVEREVDIRRRVAAIFNRREDDYESLMDYNNYLNDVEDITFNLIEGVDVTETEAKIKAYQDQNAASISENDALANREMLSYSALQAAEKKQARLRREASRREEEEEVREKEEGRKDILKLLESGNGDAAQLAEEGQKVQLKKRLDRQAAAERQRQLQAVTDTRTNTNGSGEMFNQRLRKKNLEPELPYDAFGSIKFAEPMYYTLQDDYVWEGVQDATKDVQITAGGYDVREFTSRMLREAFAGFGVFVADERSAMDEKGNAVLGTVAAAEAGTGAKDVVMEDPF